MIKANELRVGNYVLDVDGDIVTIDEIRDGFYLVKGNGRYYNTSNGIPLTPEILEKCGFEIVVELHPTYLIGKGAIVLHVTKQSGKYWHCIVYNNYEDELSERWAGIGNVQYLHQLQNLYFALTGEELNVNF